MSVPAKVRIMLQQLGPTYVKIGQMAASRSEALPPGWADELANCRTPCRRSSGSRRRR